MLRRLPISSFLLSLCLIVCACSSSGESQTVTPDSRYYAVDPVFREFYSFLGGKEILGEVISPAKDDGIKYQYTVAGLLIFDPLATPIRRFQLGPLGKDFGIPDASRKDIGVGEPFQLLYDRLGGLAFVGRPLTEISYNKEKNRSEQYFENLGFYQGPETDGHVRLLPYGAWRCGEECRDSLPANAAPLAQVPTQPIETPALPEPTVQVKSAATTTAPAQPIPTSQSSNNPTTATEQRWVIEVSESASTVARNQGQGIRVRLQRDGKPFSGVTAQLILILPNGSERSLDFPTTGSDGAARLTIEPVQAENGTKVPYQVCISGDPGISYCVQRSYMIWTTR